MLRTHHNETGPQSIEDTACAAGAVRRASRSLTRLYDQDLARAGVTTTQFSILRTLQRNGGCMPLADLAADLVFERTSLYRALVPLRRGGLVTVQPGVVRRAHDISLTKRAERLSLAPATRDEPFRIARALLTPCAVS